MSTIIKHKQFPNYKKWTMDLCGRPLTIEVGKVAELANASAMVTYGETTVMVAVTVAPRPRVNCPSDKPQSMASPWGEAVSRRLTDEGKGSYF